MSITIDLPDEIAQQLRAAWGDLSRRALEAIALEGYLSGDLSAGQVAEMLHLSTWEAESFLKERGASLNYSEEDLRRDMEANERALSR